MLPKSPWLIFARFDFLSIVVALIVINLCIFDPLFIPREDGKTKLELFHFFYNSVVQHGTWPLWMPLHTFGLPSDIWQWVGLTPTHYAAILIGKFFRVTDVAWLFKICQVSNELFFVTGLYVLGRLLWPDRFITWLVCLATGLFHWWFTDLDIKFHVFYFLPWVLWLAVTFFRTGQAWRLWAIPIGLIVWMMGNCLYYIFLWGWLMAAFIGVLWWLKRGSFQPNFSGRYNRAMLLAMLLAGAAFYWQFHSFFTQTASLLRVGAGKNPLSDFMTYGPVYQGSWENIVHYFVLGDSKEIFLPTLLLIFAVWTLCFVRLPVAIGLMAMTGFLVCFSF